MGLGSVCKQDESFRCHNSLNYKILPAGVWRPDFGIGIGKKDRIAKRIANVSDTKILHEVGAGREGCRVT